LLLLVACAGGAPTPADCPAAPSTVRFGGGTALHVRIADDDADRATGLMGVDDLPADEGMAFVWDEPTTSTFWMKDTLIPLSIAFVDEGGSVITVREMVPCTTETCPTYAARGPYTMALEANAGWFGNHAVGVGDEAVLDVKACT
jgi:uncharacterized membrane protein (UPF0127 family)